MAKKPLAECGCFLQSIVDGNSSPAKMQEVARSIIKKLDIPTRASVEVRASADSEPTLNDPPVQEDTEISALARADETRKRKNKKASRWLKNSYPGLKER